MGNPPIAYPGACNQGHIVMYERQRIGHHFLVQSALPFICRLLFIVGALVISDELWRVKFSLW